ncbi:MAG: VTT domain-containing protein [Candidatus Doudnabacteria bacterium]|nr:VTT domain-containing protein [Candidatus Doudnabacteria bacterium]
MKLHIDKSLVAVIVTPLIFFVLSIAYMLIWRAFDLPVGDALVASITEFFARYGLLVVFISSILESALLLGNYFPGGVVIFMSVVAARGNVWGIVAAVCTVSAGFSIGYGIDYLLGRYGWYRLFLKFGLAAQLESAQVKLLRHSKKAFAFSYWEPNIASITATAAGVLRMPVREFLMHSSIALLCWNIFWGAVVGFIGKDILFIFSSWKYVIAALFAWLFGTLVFELWRRHRAVA